ncbi:hypothetical protein BHM03_00015573 [Ensete ventricosum]|nr:hypothetical protein BHM03_00015573 [Ensete ventricosum]
MQTLNTGSLFYATLNALSYFYMVCSWGGYTFIINLIPMHVLLCIVTGRYSPRLYIAYAPLVSISSYTQWKHLIINFPFSAVCCAVVAILIALVASSPTKGWSGRSLSLLDP